jgi:hypothetical protein
MREKETERDKRKLKDKNTEREKTEKKMALSMPKLGGRIRGQYLKSKKTNDRSSRHASEHASETELIRHEA